MDGFQFSSMRDEEWKYRKVAPLLAAGSLPVSDGHNIAWREYGKNAKGELVVFLHGGPGGGTGEEGKESRFFNPDRFLSLVYDQRGCGNSQPNVADDAAGGLKNNTLGALVEDIEKLRIARGVDKIHVFGGSWGATLALAYAIKHPTRVKSLTLRGVFLCRKEDLDFLYQGNATNLNDERPAGAYHFRQKGWEERGFKEPYSAEQFKKMQALYKAAWEEYVDVIPQAKRGDMIKAYAKLFNTPAKTAEEKAHLTRALNAWSQWEGMASFVAPDPKAAEKFGDPEFARVFSRIENHFFDPATEAFPPDNYILKNVHRIVRSNPDLPITIVQGNFDQVCPRFQADDLAEALKAAGGRNVNYILTHAGHSANERETAKALTRAMDELTVKVAETA